MNILILWETAQIIAAVSIFAATGALIVAGGAAIATESAKRTWSEFGRVFVFYLLYGLPVGLLAYLSGFLSGISRVAVLGTVMPAILALIGGVNIYVFGSDSKYKLVVGYCIALFALMLFVGIEEGGWERERGRENRLIYLSDQEARIRTYRANRDLPPDFPSWIMGGEAQTK